MSPKPLGAISVEDGFPRVSGDEPPGVDMGRLQMTFSPRERG